MVYENKINNLNGKEWLKHSINFWTLEDLDSKTIFNEFLCYCYKDRNGVGYSSNLDSCDIKENDFSFTLCAKLEDINYFFNRACCGTYDSYHVFLCEDEIIDDINVLYTVTSYAKKVGLEYRGKIIISTKKYDTYKIALLYLNRGIKSCDMLELQHINNSSYKKGYILESKSKIDEVGLKHPAPYSYIDIHNICEKEKIYNKTILDPFLGVGSTIIGSYKNNYNIGIELNETYVDLIRERITSLNIPDEIYNKCKIVKGNSLLEVLNINETIDDVITSPPYYTILKNKTSGVRTDESQSRQGIEYYSDNKDDLGNVESYDEYLDKMKTLFERIKTKMADDGFVYIVVSDFTVKKKEVDVHSDYIRFMTDLGYLYCGTSYLFQNQKTIYPFGYPFKLVLNHIYQYVIKFKVS